MKLPHRLAVVASGSAAGRSGRTVNLCAYHTVGRRSTHLHLLRLASLLCCGDLAFDSFSAIVSIGCTSAGAGEVEKHTSPSRYTQAGRRPCSSLRWHPVSIVQVRPACRYLHRPRFSRTPGNGQYRARYQVKSINKIQSFVDEPFARLCSLAVATLVFVVLIYFLAILSNIREQMRKRE